MIKPLIKTNKNLIKYEKQVYDAIILSVPHKKIFKFIKNNLNRILKNNGFFIDLNNNYELTNKTNYKYIKL